MKFYKVVDENLNSYVITGFYKVHYSIGKWVKPKVGKLFCFDNIEEAKFLAGDKDKIFECEAKNPQRYCGLILCGSRDKKSIREFWSFYCEEQDTMKLPLLFASEHTVLADAVKLIKEVK